MNPSRFAGFWTVASIARSRPLAIGLIVLLLGLSLTGCGGGASTEANPVTTPPNAPTYSGPPPATADVQAFRINLWENIKATNRCGQCHGAGGQVPMFARTDDVNLAYEAANTAVNLTQPADSRMVVKVGGGHNCWLAADSACADLLTTWITNWAGAAGGSGTQIQLVPPPIKDVGQSRNFPDTAPASFAGVHNLLTTFCSRCHTSSAVTPQAPYFASADIDEAYEAAKTKINLDNAAQSRLVVRLRNEFHNCWPVPAGGAPNCAGSADTMEAAIQAMIDSIPLTQVDPSLVISKALTLYDGTVASGGSRFDSNAIAKWEFKTGSGATAYDTSGVEPALNLTLSGDVAWVGGWGINVRMGGKAQGSTASSKKLHDLIRGTGEYTLETWVAPANVAQEDAFIMSYSGGTASRNFTVAQQQYQIEALNRSSTTDSNGQPSVITNAADEDLQATLQHVVVTFDPVNGRRVYVNGEFTGDTDQNVPASISDWDDTFAFVLGNEVSNDRQFQGVYRLVVVHNRVLTPTQILQNFEAGVGERYYLLFSVAHLISVPQSYIMFEASQYDSYSYLFNKPTFVSLDGTAMPGSIPLRGMRIGENGVELKVGQAYRTLDTTISDANYTPATGQLLSSIGTVVALEKGPADDLFFLCFDVLGSNSQVCSTDAAPIPAPIVNLPAQPDIGIKIFDDINASMAAVTGVSPTTTSVAGTFNQIKQALPTAEAIEGFSSSQQAGITQLAVAYCNSLSNNTTLRATVFPTFTNWSASPSTAFATQAERDKIITPLYNRAVGLNLQSQPTLATVSGELNSLIDRLLAGSANTTTVVTAVCAATIGSAVTTVQ
ncbi:MAG TPA: LamG domain-containing protein [Steroidobacteraceae bacterium]